MPAIKYTLYRGDEAIALEIDYSVGPFDPGNSCGLPEDCELPSGGEIEDLAIFGPDEAEFTLTPTELQKVEDHIYATHDYYD